MQLPDIALSVRQPWAWAIIFGGKDIENRSRAAVSHGMDPRRIAVHAAKGMTRDEYEDARETMAKIGVTCPRPDQLTRGAVIGAVTVTAIVNDHESPWFFGPRGLVLSDAEASDVIPSVGALGYFRWKRDGQFLAPLPWMVTWPEGVRKAPGRPKQPASAPLFEQR